MWQSTCRHRPRTLQNILILQVAICRIINVDSELELFKHVHSGAANRSNGQSVDLSHDSVDADVVEAAARCSGVHVRATIRTFVV